MDIKQALKWFDRLLPRCRAWGLVIKRFLRDMWEGLTVLPLMIRDHLTSLMMDLWPATTTLLLDWSVQFGRSKAESRDYLRAQWAATGGQSPGYMQTILQTAGFDVYVHEWWEPGTEPPVARDPIALLAADPLARLLVNDTGVASRKYRFQYGDGTQYKNTAACSGPEIDKVRYGRFNGYFFIPEVYPTPDEWDLYPDYFYIGAATWPQHADVLATQISELISLIYKLKPTHLRCILLLTAVSEPWQDTVGSLDVVQDTTTSGDEIQDVIL